jgi:hypothetical protein
MALLVFILGSKNKEKCKKNWILRDTPVQIFTKKGLNPIDGTFELFKGPGTRKILEILKFDNLRVFSIKISTKKG